MPEEDPKQNETAPKKQLMTSDFQWEPINQVRCGVLVSAVIKLITEPPRPVVEMSLKEWRYWGRR